MVGSPFNVITGGVVSVGIEVPELFPPPPVVEFPSPTMFVDVLVSLVAVVVVVGVVSVFTIIIEPFTTVDAVADTKGSVFVCSK